ncbi:MAG: T9SS type A sorting domain-containing protein [Lewinella sp.]
MSVTTGRMALWFFFFCRFLFLSTGLSAQPVNDDILNPLLLSADSLCLSPVAATLETATSAGPAAAGCAFGPDAGGPPDVWFTFTAPSTTANISLELGELSSFMFVGEIYTAGGTPVFVECFMGFGGIVTNYSTENLMAGQAYLLRVYDDGTMMPQPGDPQDFFVCMNFLPNLEVAGTFGGSCNDVFDLPTFTGSGNWKYLTVNGGLAIGLLDSEAFSLTAASLYTDFAAATMEGPFGTLLTRTFGAATAGALTGPLRIRLFISTEEFAAFLNEGFSASELLLHQYPGLSCGPIPPAVGIPDFFAPLGFGMVGQRTVYLEYEVTDLAAFFLGEGDLGLPVTWGSLNGRAQGKNNVVDWTTVREENTDHFVVERSEAGIAWEEISQLTAAGNADAEQAYVAIDEAPLARVFYRIRQYDRDGRNTISRMIEVRRNSTIGRVYPNPATDLVTLPFAGEIRVLDGRGREHLNSATVAQDINVSALPSGVYWLELRSVETGRVFRDKLIKQ